MKFYDCSTAPSPRRVRMFLAEKGVEVPTVQVDLRSGEHMTEAFRTLNPWCTVPVLVLDDGTAISEATAVCRYLEAAYPDPPLMGRSARDQGVVAMWDHRCEIDGFLAVTEAFRNATPGMKGRALAGPLSFEQIPALVERGRARVERFYAALDERLVDTAFVGGDDFSVADITAFVSVEFAAWIKMSIPDACANVSRWYGHVKQRPSAAA